jgi:glyoxylase-like metal-dependent hydrolase (beta-lactamase superfamily II)
MSTPPLSHVQPEEVTDLSAGFLTREMSPGVYMVTNGNYQTIFLTTGTGVVLLDAPLPLIEHLGTAISDVTEEPLTTLIYSHGHSDHIGGARRIVEEAGRPVEIIAEKGTAHFLAEKADPERPLPTTTFVDRTVLRIGDRTIHLIRDDFHTAGGDTVLFLPDEKVLVAIDLLARGWVPLLDFDLTENVYSYMHAFDRFLEYDFEYFISGHTADIARREDVELTNRYVKDVYETVKRLHDEINTPELLEEHRDSEQAGIKFIIEEVVRRATAELSDRWLNGPMKGVELWTESHARAMTLYVRWTD